jgi:hypothetical protein
MAAHGGAEGPQFRIPDTAPCSGGAKNGRARPLPFSRWDVDLTHRVKIAGAVGLTFTIARASSSLVAMHFSVLDAYLVKGSRRIGPRRGSKTPAPPPRKQVGPEAPAVAARLLARRRLAICELAPNEPREGQSAPDLSARVISGGWVGDWTAHFGTYRAVRTPDQWAPRRHVERSSAARAGTLARCLADGHFVPVRRCPWTNPHWFRGIVASAMTAPIGRSGAQPRWGLQRDLAVARRRLVVGQPRPCNRP